jgi:uncharacterized protein YjdB
MSSRRTGPRSVEPSNGFALLAACLSLIGLGSCSGPTESIEPGPVVTVVVKPAADTLALGGSVRLTATPEDARGRPKTSSPVTWSSSNATVATVDANGFVKGRTVGAASIRASSEGQSGTAAVAVLSFAPVSVVLVNPVSVTVLVAGSVQLTATAKDASGNPLPDRPLTWSSSNAAVATVNSSGLVAARTAGTTTITAGSEGKSGTAAVTVLTSVPVPVTSVVVSPPSPTIEEGGSVQLTATPKDAGGNPLADRTVTWSSGNTAVASVNGGGLVTGHTAGTATITATSEGKSGTATVTVVTPAPAPVASVVVAPPSPMIDVGGSVQLTATPKDASGNPLPGRTVTWSSGSTAVATVNASGLVTGRAAGTATITATSEGKSGTAAVTVVTPPPVPVASVQVAPPSATINVGGSVQLTATPKDASGNPLTGRSVTWSSGNTAAATVSSSGLVTGQASGTATITATSEGKSGTAAVTVATPPPPPPPPPPGSGEVLVGAGDIADCGPGAEQTAQLLDGIPGTVFTVGDNAYPSGSDADYANCFDPTWGRHKSRIWPCPGNKEYSTPGAAGYFRYFGSRAGPVGLGYYSFDLGDWHIVSLNSGVAMTVGSPQEQWLRADLAANSRDCILAIWHHPRFSAGPAHTMGRSAAVFQALYEAGAEVVVVGHDHNYQRFAPQSPDGQLDLQHGIREFVVGTGGAPRDTVLMPAANTEASDFGTWGVLELTLGPGTYSWQFVPVAGGSFTDSGSGTCHGPASPALSVRPGGIPAVAPDRASLARRGTLGSR